MKALYLATENKHKWQEFQSLLGAQVELLPMPPQLSLPEEGVKDYVENARAKAEYLGKMLKSDAIGDDSGLEVLSLGGAPGVISARFGGTDPATNRRTLLDKLHGEKNRSARFVCLLAYYSATAEATTVYFGEVKGEIALEERGALGFGYDSLFIPDGFDQTMAEISDEVKNKISHRAMATQRLLDFLNSVR